MLISFQMNASTFFLQGAGGDGEQVLDPGHAIRHPGRVMIEQLSGHLALLGQVGLLCGVLQECFGKAVSDESHHRG